MNSFTSPRFRLGWTLIFIGFLSSLFWTAYRWRYENHFDKVQITLDYEDTRQMADSFGVSQLSLLRKFRQNGATSLALYEQSLSNFQNNGRLSIVQREAAEKLFPTVNWAKIPNGYRNLVVINPDNGQLTDQIFPRLVEQSVSTRTREDAAIPPVEEDLGPDPKDPKKRKVGILLPTSRELFNDAQLGFDQTQLALAKKAGLNITARISNPLNVNPQRVERVLDDINYVNAHYMPCHVVLFSDEAVLGYQTLISTVARQMRAHGLIFTTIEFGKQMGMEEFAKDTEGMIARAHSVGGDEASKMKMEALVDRYVRAARERDIRVLYIRMVKQFKGEAKPAGKATALAEKPILKENAYNQNLDFVRQVSTELARQPLPFAWLRPGLQGGEAQAFGNFPLDSFSWHPKLTRWLMIFVSGLASVGAVLLLMNLAFDIPRSRNSLLALLGIMLLAACSLSAGMGAKMVAQVAGSSFTVIAMLWCGLPLVWDGRLRPKPKAGVVIDTSPTAVGLLGLKILLKATGITLIGGLTIVAVLNNWTYMSVADDFWGKKLTQFVPLLLVGLCYLGEIFPHRVEREGSQAGRALMKARVNRMLERPFTVQTAILAVVGAGAVYIWMSRFGNESGMEISPLELKLRSVLEKVFITRPRTKEIAIGQPAMLFSVLFMLRREKLLAMAVVVLATIGQTDVLNTMCHIHTPLFYSLWRTWTGLFLGAFVGFLALVAYDLFERWRDNRSVQDFVREDNRDLDTPTRFRSRPTREQLGLEGDAVL